MSITNEKIVQPVLQQERREMQPKYKWTFAHFFVPFKLEDSLSSFPPLELYFGFSRKYGLVHILSWSQKIGQSFKVYSAI